MEQVPAPHRDPRLYISGVPHGSFQHLTQSTESTYIGSMRRKLRGVSIQRQETSPLLGADPSDSLADFCFY
jgi:hypothetical protein